MAAASSRVSVQLVLAAGASTAHSKKVIALFYEAKRNPECIIATNHFSLMDIRIEVNLNEPAGKFTVRIVYRGTGLATHDNADVYRRFAALFSQANIGHEAAVVIVDEGGFTQYKPGLPSRPEGDEAAVLVAGTNVAADPAAAAGPEGSNETLALAGIFAIGAALL